MGFIQNLTSQILIGWNHQCILVPHYIMLINTKVRPWSGSAGDMTENVVWRSQGKQQRGVASRTDMKAKAGRASPRACSQRVNGSSGHVIATIGAKRDWGAAQCDRGVARCDGEQGA